jgi:hypothetical protein
MERAGGRSGLRPGGELAKNSGRLRAPGQPVDIQDD